MPSANSFRSKGNPWSMADMRRKMIPANVDIRALARPDAGRVIKLIAALSAHEGAPPPTLDVEALVTYCLGDTPRFQGLVADLDGMIVGYALYHGAFHIGRGTPGSFLMDLYVERRARRQGIARALLAAVGRATIADGGDWLTWQAHPRNPEALAFYDSVGARRFAAADYELAGADLRRLFPY